MCLSGVTCVPLKDELVALPVELSTDRVIDMPSYDHSLYRDDYLIPRPNLDSHTVFSSRGLSLGPASGATTGPTPTTSPATVSARETPPGGETRALTLLTDYLMMGESLFNQRYAVEYAHTFGTTKSHREAIQRLTNGYLSTAAVARSTSSSATPTAGTASGVSE